MCKDMTRDDERFLISAMRAAGRSTGKAQLSTEATVKVINDGRRMLLESTLYNMILEGRVGQYWCEDAADFVVVLLEGDDDV